MTVEELSEKILNEGEIEHHDGDWFVTDEDLNSDREPTITSDDDSLSHYGAQFADESDSLEHYGVLGMKWGIRKDRDGNRVEKRKKRDRRYEDETDQEYQNRMQRESQERIAKTQAKERLETQKRALKSQEKLQRMQIESQRKQKEADARNQQKMKKLESEDRKRQAELAAKEAKQRRKDEAAAAKRAAKEKTKSKPTNERHLTDKELNDAIQRLRNEKTYKELSLQNKSLPTKTIVKAATIGGGILLAVGTAVAKKQLTDVGNQKASEYLKKKGLLKESDPKDKDTGSKGVSVSDFNDLVETVKDLKEKFGG